jgi:GTPase KRas
MQLCLNHFVETYDPTIEDSYRKQVQIDGQSCMLEVLDTAGQEEYTALRDQWIRDGEGFVLVYSISSRSSFTRIQKFHHQIQRVKEAASAGSPTYPGSPLSQTMGSISSGPAPVMLVGNKCDRVTEREVSTQEGSALAKQLNCEFVEASAKNCVNVEKAFYDVVRQLRKQRASAPGRGGEVGRTRTQQFDDMPRYKEGHEQRYYSNSSGGRNGGRRDKYRSSKSKSGGGSKCVIL